MSNFPEKVDGVNAIRMPIAAFPVNASGFLHYTAPAKRHVDHHERNNDEAWPSGSMEKARIQLRPHRDLAVCAQISLTKRRKQPTPSEQENICGDKSDDLTVS